jgi:hypothetical protein
MVQLVRIMSQISPKSALVKRRFDLRRLTISLSFALLLWASDDPREIWDDGFRAKRPVGAAQIAAPSKSLTYSAKPAPQAIRNGPSAAPTTPVVGVTLWRIRKPEPRELDAPRLLVPEGPSNSSVEYVAERIRLDDPLYEGERIRLAIESPREGFLYVVDRERYVDGTHSEPYLLFPLPQFNGGGNRVTAGKLIEIPARSDSTKALRVVRQGDRHVGEEMLIVYSQAPLAGVEADSHSHKLPQALVAGWERDFAPAPVRLDLESSGGLWTSSEKAAGETQRLLTPEDPMPQYIFAGSGDRSRPFLVHVPLEVK